MHRVIPSWEHAHNNVEEEDVDDKERAGFGHGLGIKPRSDEDKLRAPCVSQRGELRVVAAKLAVREYHEGDKDEHKVDHEVNGRVACVTDGRCEVVDPRVGGEEADEAEDAADEEHVAAKARTDT